jgi:hypothetical protein
MRPKNLSHWMIGQTSIPVIASRWPNSQPPRGSIYLVSLSYEPFNKRTRKPMLILTLPEITYGLTLVLALSIPVYSCFTSWARSRPRQGSLTATITSLFVRVSTENAPFHTIHDPAILFQYTADNALNAPFRIFLESQ